MKIVDYPSYLDNAVVIYINGIVETMNESDFDENEFLNWLEINDVKSKTRPSAYVKACFKKELENGTFRQKAKVDYIPNTQELINALREKGIVILADDTNWLSVAWWHILNVIKLPIDECKKLNRNILEYMKTKEFDEYKQLLVNSNTLKPLNIDWKVIELEASVVHKSWLELMDKIESEE